MKKIFTEYIANSSDNELSGGESVAYDGSSTSVSIFILCTFPVKMQNPLKY